MKLDDRVALVTGGAKRVGRAIALELARGGCHVAVHYHHSAADAQQTCEDIQALGRRAMTVCGDLADPDSWPNIMETVVAAFGRLDVLVNNASIFPVDQEDSIKSFDRGQWERLFRVNLIAPAALCHHAAPHLRAQGGGCIVNLCDVAAERPWKNYLAYCASKAGLAAVTKSLAKALAPEVRVNGVSPGIAVFPEGYDESLRRKLVDRVPLGREGTPGEVASLVRFIAEGGDYMTGQIVAIDGGRSVV